MERNNSNNKPIVVGILLILSIWGAVLGYWYATGVIFSDARITNFALCTDDTVYAPIKSIPIPADGLYFCGIIQGTGKWDGLLELFKDGTFIAREGLTLEPGAFFVPASRLLPISSESVFASGYYRATIVVSNHVAKEVEFQITD